MIRHLFIIVRIMRGANQKGTSFGVPLICHYILKNNATVKYRHFVRVARKLKKPFSTVWFWILVVLSI